MRVELRGKQSEGDGMVADRRSARTQCRFWMVAAGLLMLVTLSLFGVPSTAHAAPIVVAEEERDVRSTATSAARGGTGSLWASPKAARDGGGCGQHGGAPTSSGCCAKAKCPLTHSGIPPDSPLAAPSQASLDPLPSSSPLFKGIGTLPALRPPSASA